MPPRKRRSFTAEYKVEAAHRVIDSARTVAEVARELGIHESLLGTWGKDERRRIAVAEIHGEKPLDTAERAELARLRRQVAEQDKDIAFLKKSVGVLCRDADEPTRFDLMAEYAGPDTVAGGFGQFQDCGNRGRVRVGVRAGLLPRERGWG